MAIWLIRREKCQPLREQERENALRLWHQKLERLRAQAVARAA